METKRRCYSCLYYSAYYTKGLSRFDLLDYGSCGKRGERLQDKHGTCEDWHGKYDRRNTRRALAMVVLARAADSINVLRQIFEEEQEERE